MTPPKLTPSRASQVRIGLALRRRLSQREAYDRSDDAARIAWRNERLAELIGHAERSSDHYRHLADLPAPAAASSGVSPLAALPVLDKADLVEHFDRLVTAPGLRRADLEPRLLGGPVGGRARSDRYRVAMTSGSSGSPAVLAFDEREWVGLIANAARARALAGRPHGGSARSAKVGSPSPWHLSVQVPATLQDPRKPSLALSAAVPISATTAALQEWSPSILSSYPSVLRQLLGEQGAGTLDIHPTQVFSSGEHLSTHTRGLVRDVWGAEVFDQYVATEVGFIAAECAAHDGLHVMDDHVVVEVVDDHGEACPPGVEGQVLVTPLHSRTLPLIRYRLGDRATFAEGACACRRPGPRLSSIAGADRDVLVFRSADESGPVSVHPVTITALVDRLPVGTWVVLHRPEAVVLQVTRPGAAFDAGATEAELRENLRGVGVHRDVDVRVEVVASIEATAGGKAARFRDLPDGVG